MKWKTFIRVWSHNFYFSTSKAKKIYILNSCKHFFFQNFRSLREYTLDHVQHTHNFSINHFASCLHRICQLWNKKITLFFSYVRTKSISSLYFQFPEFFLELAIFFTHKKMIIIKKSEEVLFNIAMLLIDSLSTV